MFPRQDLFIIAFLSALDTYGAWLALSIFFFSRACLPKTLKNISSNLLHESTYSRENSSFKSLLNFLESKYLQFLYCISRSLFLTILVFKTVRTYLWNSDNPVLTILVLWKESALFVKFKSIQLEFEMLLKQVLSLTRLLSSCW